MSRHRRHRQRKGRNLIPATVTTASPPALRQGELAVAADFARADKSENTRKAYRSDLALFAAWCAERHVASLPAAPETVAAYLAAEAKGGAKASTIGRRVAAIRYGHKLAGHPAPTDHEAVRATVRGIRRTIGVAPTKKAPATCDRIIAMAPRGASLIEKRDRALLLIGFAGAFRRSELVGLNVGDIEESREGLRVTIRRGKTDQEGKSEKIGIVRGEIACPVAALSAWLKAAGIERGPIFRPVAKGGKVQGARLSGRSVAAIVKTHARRVGLEPAGFAGHSLRSGFITSAMQRRAPLFKVMGVSRHKSVDTLHGYVIDAEIFRDHAGIGLL